MKKILFIDDDKTITLVFKDSFKDYFEITSFNNTKLALSDLRINPDIIRILITGYHGSNEIERHLKSNIAQGLIFKPWNYDQVSEIITKHLPF